MVVIESEPAGEEPAGAGETRIMVIDPVSLSAEHQAQAWLEDLLGEAGRAVGEGMDVVNRVVYLHRLAAADPHVHELTPTQATAARAGWGEGEQLADGSLESRARAAAPGSRARGACSAAAPGASAPRSSCTSSTWLRCWASASSRSLCEELALRARLDLDSGRLAHAALQLRQALTTAVAELRGEARQDLLLRVDELEQLSGGVEREAERVLQAAQAGPAGRRGPGPDGELLAHALGRLEAALRAHQRRV